MLYKTLILGALAYTCLPNVIGKARVFFYFSFYRPSRPIFLKIENFILYFPPTHASTVVEFNYVFRFVFSPATRLIKLPQVPAPGEILPFELVK